MTDLCCPVCGAELGLDHLFVDADNRAAVARLIEVALPLGGRLLQYTRLFAPSKTRLTQRKQVRIILQLLPDLERCAITHRGRDWAVPLTIWAQGIDHMLASRDAGKLDLPMKGHGYLYAILVSLADKVEAGTEAQAEANKRTPVLAASYQVRGQAMPMGQALAQVFGGVDPALAKLDADAQKVAPMPQAVRDKLQQIKNKIAKA
ncbi:hypothetical protein [Rhodoferax sp.]|uniref:hypothetical protein n=1 Tax=Rhodoferax sp. TaxID=50421 RepID=UPI002611C483|nr:hypothetical protein [Rhodoferax sp.]MDD5479662.1 hypothetical protein [Rhodoferax sp.]